MKIAVAGTGYVGLSLAVLLAQHNQVTAVDIIPEKVEKLRTLGVLSVTEDADDENRMMISDPPREIQKTENPCAGNVVNR